MACASWRSAGVDGATRWGLEVFRRLPQRLRRQLTRLITPNYTLGVVAVFTDPDGRVLLLRTRHHRGWGLPGGLAGRGESPAQTLVRELREELGAEVDLTAVERAPEVAVVDVATQQVTVVVTLPPPRRIEPDGIEVVDAQWFDPSALPSPLTRGTADSIAQAVPARR